MERQRIGDFQILRTLGQGGMGAVYECTRIGSASQDSANHDVPERVAVKVLLSRKDNDSDSENELRQRFVSEINTLKHLRHPNIVRLYGFGADDGHPYYVMELVDGLSLSAELKLQRRFEWIEAAKIGLDLCRALKYAGDRGIIHRDIKPANIMLDRAGGVIKLADFGIAHFFGADQAYDTQSIIGTLEYMAPEQAMGRPVGPKADLYAVGAVLYTLLARRPPHLGKTLAEIREKHQHETIVPISSLRRDIPPDITFLIDELLHVDPQKRPISPQMVVRRFQATLRALVGDPDKILLTPTDTSRSAPPVNEMTKSSSPDQATMALPTGASPESSARQSALPSARLDAPTPVSVPIGETISPRDAQVNTRIADDDSNDDKDKEDFGATPANDLASDADLQTYQIARPDTINVVAESSSPASHQSHFVVVHETELGHYETPPVRVLRPLFVIKTVSLVVCLAAVAAVMVYLLQPLSADTLLQRINATIADAAGNDDSDRLAALRMAEHNMNAFLRRFPEHASSGVLQGYLDELHAAERQRHLETRLLRLDPRQLLPIERAFLETWAIRQSDPELAAERMRAILQLYRKDRAASSEAASPVETASRVHSKLESSREDQVLDRIEAQIQLWEATQTTIQAETLRFIRQRLDEATALETTDPESASAIRRAIVELYSSKLWAAEVVKAAAR